MEHLIFTQGGTARGTNKTQAFPTISAIWASGRWVCLGLLGTISRTQFRTQADVVYSSPKWSTYSLVSRRIVTLVLHPHHRLRSTRRVHSSSQPAWLRLRP